MKNFGFTLIEFLIVIGIIGILAMIGVPVFRSYQPDIQLSGIVRNLVADLRYAQQLTVTEQVEHGVRFCTSTENYQIIKYLSPEEILKEENLPPEVTFGNIEGFINNEVRFNAYGAVNKSGFITLENSKGGTTIIEIRPSGFIKILK